MHGASSQREAAGFTLLELLVAIAVFAFVGAMAMGGLNSLIRQRENTRDTMIRLKHVQQAVSILSRDLEQAVDRPVRDILGGSSVGAILGAEMNLPQLVFTRSGWSNPLLEPRSTLERVAYEVSDDKLIRLSWPVLDRTQETEPARRILLNHVKRLEVRYLDAQGTWQTQWPPINVPPAQALDMRPEAVEVTLELDDWGKIRRLLEIAS